MTKIVLIGAGSSVGRHILASGDPRFVGVYRGAKALSQLCDLQLGERLVRAGSNDELKAAVAGADAVVTLVNDVNPASALNSVKETARVCVHAGVPQLIHVSSAAIYGPDAAALGQGRGIGRSMTWNPYAAGKQWQENYLRRASPLPASTVVLRPGLIWGPSMAWLHIPASELFRGTAWVAKSDTLCNLVNVNLLVHAILEMVTQRPSGLNFINIRDSETLTWSDYYRRIAQHLELQHSRVVEIQQHDTPPWRGQPGAFAATFPFGLGWSVLPKPVKAVIKKTLKVFAPKTPQGRVSTTPSRGAPVISREVWELKTVDGLPQLNNIGRQLQTSYGRTSEQDWRELDTLRDRMFL